MLNCKNTISLPKRFTVVILSALSSSRMSFKFISKINISEYKHSDNLSKAPYIKRTALSCQTFSSKFCQTVLIKEKRSTWSISNCEYICVSNDSTCPEQYKWGYCSKQYFCCRKKKKTQHILLTESWTHRNQQPCVWNHFSFKGEIVLIASWEFKYIYSHVITK